MSEPFQKIVGQHRTKSKLVFHLEAFKKGIPLPHYLFIGAKGNGKSMFCKELAREIKKHDNEFDAHLINCATIKNVNSFYEQVYDPKIRNKKAVILLDEAHNLPDVIQQLLLTTIEVDDKIERIIPTDSGSMEINTLDHVFMFMSSEPDKIFAPLRDRMEVVSLCAYKANELGDILVNHCKGITFDSDTISCICDTLRGNPRDAIKAANGIIKYCKINNKSSITANDWQKYCLLNDVKPFGLNSNEIQVLRVLVNNGACSLNDLRGATNISRTAIMNDLEPYLLSKHFIKIDGKRHITPKGREAWKMLEKYVD